MEHWNNDEEIHGLIIMHNLRCKIKHIGTKSKFYNRLISNCWYNIMKIYKNIT